MIRFCG